jgi:hypothetical protein
VGGRWLAIAIVAVILGAAGVWMAVQQLLDAKRGEIGQLVDALVTGGALTWKTDERARADRPADLERALDAAWALGA